jgi:methylmalonyl-CoA mutase
MIGVNEFPLLTDSPVDLDNVTPSAFAKASPPIAASGPDSRCEALAPWRAAEAYEHLRDRARHLSSAPVAIVATLGSVRDYAARAGFIDNALAAGGITTRRVAVADVVQGEARLVVLCGADAVYETEGVEAVSRLNTAGAGKILIAGRPSNLDGLIAAGASGALYLGGDLVSLLGDCLEAFA